MREIPVGHGRVTVVDDADYETLSQWKWNSHKPPTASCWYVWRQEPVTRKKISLHRFLMEAASGMDVDHIDGDGLNNRRSNLRVCTRSGNMMNRPMFKKRSASASRFKGVYACSGAPGKWQVSIASNGVRHHLKGRFTSEEAAARAYDDLARKHHGEFARLNFPDGPVLRFLKGMVSRVSFMQRSPR